MRSLILASAAALLFATAAQAQMAMPPGAASTRQVGTATLQNVLTQRSRELGSRESLLRREHRLRDRLSKTDRSHRGALQHRAAA